ncbi:putative C2 domain-containing protein [Helianthus annuus]|nr:putative C2 domain-containing protein [Helianthus annuus]
MYANAYKFLNHVHLELLYCPYGVESGFTDPFTSNYTMTSLEKVLKSGDTENGELGNKKRTEIIRGVLSVTVISAEDLPPTDLLGKANPFVVLSMKKTGMKNSTRVVSENLYPVWNQTFDFVVEDGLHDMLIVEVYDHDTFGKVQIWSKILFFITSIGGNWAGCGFASGPTWYNIMLKNVFKEMDNSKLHR